MPTINGATGDFGVPVNEGACYRDAIQRAIRGVARNKHGALIIPVVVVQEFDNPYDANAVKVVDADQKTLGYLTQSLGSAYAPVLARIRDEGDLVECDAQVLGGDPARPTYSLWLDLCSPVQLQEIIDSEVRLAALPTRQEEISTKNDPRVIACLIVLGAAILIMVCNILT